MTLLMKVETMMFSQRGNGYHVGGNISEKEEILEY